MNLISASFAEGDFIPKNHTAEGANLSPPLAWSDVPAGTKSLVLLLEDRDAYAPTSRDPFTHWVVLDLQPSLAGLSLGANRTGLPVGARIGLNDFGRARYDGPFPDVGRHRYVFRLLALRETPDPDALGVARRADVLAAANGLVLAEASLMGLYQREHAESRPVLGGH